MHAYACDSAANLSAPYHTFVRGRAATYASLSFGHNKVAHSHIEHVHARAGILSNMPQAL